MYNTEVWHEITVPGFENLYEISSNGRVRNIRTRRILKHHIDVKGYPRLQLSNNNDYINIRIHQLVAAAFLGPCPPGREIDHKDDNKLNFEISNLHYVTARFNQRKSWTQGRRAQVENPKCTKLSKDDVIMIRKSNLSDTELGLKLGVSKGNIWNIRQYKSWKHLA